jgi:hypothetical protein
VLKLCIRAVAVLVLVVSLGCAPTGTELTLGSWVPIHTRVAVDLNDNGELTVYAARPGVAEVDKPEDVVAAGYEQRIRLDQDAPRLIVAQVESLPTNLATKRTQDYALALELYDAKGRLIAAPHVPLESREEVWQSATLTYVPSQPVAVAVLQLRCLAQRGSAQFRNPFIASDTGDNDVMSIDGVVLSADAATTEGWWIYEVGTQTLFPVHQASEHGLTFSAQSITDNDTIRHELTLTDATGQDRPLRVLFLDPISRGANRKWHAAPDASVDADAGEYLSGSDCLLGRGQMSQWPIAATTLGGQGQAIAFDISRPAVYRLGMSVDAGCLYAAFDIALTPEHETTTVSAITYAFDAIDQPFRQALAKYYELYPDAYTSRLDKHGIWMPFGYVSGIPDWQDFGFHFVEGVHQSNWTGTVGLLSFHYVEPMTWWMPMNADTPRSAANAQAIIEQRRTHDDLDALSYDNSVFKSPDSRPRGYFVAAPWCDGIVWSMNAAPGIERPNHFETMWNEGTRNWIANSGEGTQGVSGLYLDSIEGYITEELDYAREHFGAMDTPLTYDAYGRPAIFKELVVFEFLHAVANDLRAMDKYTMANTTPGRVCYLVPDLDVLGSETDWNIGGRWSPPSHAGMIYLRGMTGEKPYCTLMNSNFKVFSRKHTERYIKRCVAYGMYPGFFSPNAFDDTYFSNPDLYERDRPVFKKYLPLCRRAGEAGWKPITHASTTTDDISVERFGDDLLTVFNHGAWGRKVTITLTGPMADFTSATDLVTDKAIEITDNTITITLGAEDVAVLEFD